MIFSIAVVGLAGFGMLSALAHFILRLKTKPARKYKQKIQKVKIQKMVNIEMDIDFFIKSLAGGIESARASISKEETLIIASSGHGHSSVG